MNPLRCAAHSKVRIRIHNLSRLSVGLYEKKHIVSASCCLIDRNHPVFASVCQRIHGICLIGQIQLQIFLADLRIISGIISGCLIYLRFCASFGFLQGQLLNIEIQIIIKCRHITAFHIGRKGKGIPFFSNRKPDRIPGQIRIILRQITHIPAELFDLCLLPIDTTYNKLLRIRILVRNLIINITVMLCGKFFGFLIFHNFYPGLCILCNAGILCSFGVLCFFLFCTGLIHFLIPGRSQCIIDIFLYAVPGQVNTAANQQQNSCQNHKYNHQCPIRFCFFILLI